MELNQCPLHSRLFSNANEKLWRRRGCARSLWFIFLSLQTIFAVAGRPLWETERLTIATSALKARASQFFDPSLLQELTKEGFIKSLWQGGR